MQNSAPLARSQFAVPLVDDVLTGFLHNIYVKSKESGHCWFIRGVVSLSLKFCVWAVIWNRCAMFKLFMSLNEPRMRRHRDEIVPDTEQPPQLHMQSPSIK